MTPIRPPLGRKLPDQVLVPYLKEPLKYAPMVRQFLGLREDAIFSVTTWPPERVGQYHVP